LTGVAVNVTGELVHSGLAEATIETLTGKLALIDIVIMFEVAGFPVEQVILDVSIHFT
jgi:hypothetical protein